jgi:two-component system CheB/CheR fusion protein
LSFVAATPRKELITMNSEPALPAGSLPAIDEVLRDLREQLEHATARLKSRDESMCRFLGLISQHVYAAQTPLMFATFKAEHHRDPEGVAHAAKYVLRGMDDLNRLSEGLDSAAKILRGEIKINRQPVDLRELVDDRMRLFDESSGSAFRYLRYEAASEPLIVIGDPAYLEKVFADLMATAIRSTRQKSEIAVRTAQEDGEAVVRFRDNGQGIDADRLPHVFDLLAQATTTRTGFEFGLAFDYLVIEKLGGSITVHSDGPGRGSEFTVRLPLAGRSV